MSVEVVTDCDGGKEPSGMTAGDSLRSGACLARCTSRQRNLDIPPDCVHGKCQLIASQAGDPQVKEVRFVLPTRLVSGLCLLVACASPVAIPESAAAARVPSVPVQRVFGSDAIATSIAISQAEFPAAQSAEAAVLARSDFFADALAGGPLAAHVGGPLLITPGAAESSSLDPRVLQEIERVLPAGRAVYVLGGDLALSPDVDATLRAAGYEVVRVAGTSEYETAVDVAEQLGNPSTIFEATGLNFADALSAVPAAIVRDGAILLTDGRAQAPATAAYLAAHPGDTRYAVGGPLAAYGADPSATPVYGKSQYGTSAAVAAEFFPSPSRFGAATGTSFPDALSGGVLMGAANKGPLLLVQPSGPLSLPVASYLTGAESGLVGGDLFGGALAVGPDVLGELESISPSGVGYGPGPMGSYTVQAQPPPGSCHYRYIGSDPLPDRTCTPGALNPQVTQSTIGTTICTSGYTASIRPPETITGPEKSASALAYHYTGSFSTAEFDHLVPLELGGDPNDPTNLWIEPNDNPRATTFLNAKDVLENKLKDLVCSDKLPLAAAQNAIVTNWVTAYKTYVGSLPTPTSPPSSSPGASCSASAASANDGYAGDYYVSIRSNQPYTAATAHDATDTWSDETNGTGYVRILLYHQSPGERITVTVGSAHCGATV